MNQNGQTNLFQALIILVFGGVIAMAGWQVLTIFFSNVLTELNFPHADLGTLFIAILPFLFIFGIMAFYFYTSRQSAPIPR